MEKKKLVRFYLKKKKNADLKFHSEKQGKGGIRHETVTLK